MPQSAPAFETAPPHEAQALAGASPAADPGANSAADPGAGIWRWRNRFAALGPAFHTRLAPEPLADPHWVARSDGMARELGLPHDWWRADAALQVAAGNAVPDGAQPLASVYSGHQFGVWAGQLGDGRALMLGEIEAPDGAGWEVQLKGSGRTPYSRMGDGRAVLRSSIREFLASEAMHALGVPTTRALCVVGAAHPVRRETIETAAVVTRLAPSFVRFGHFEHFAHHGLHAELRQLADFVIARHYPDCQGATNPWAALLAAVTRRTAALIAQWQALGFMHGVMNTDNMSILGLTIDYGPFQFMDGFDPAHVCNHSDHAGRYAFQRQPQVAQWNLFALGQALLPLIGETDAALAALEPYPALFAAELDQRMASRLGLPEASEASRALLAPLLALMARERTDHPIFWRRLAECVAAGANDFAPVRDLFHEQGAAQAWLLRYRELRTQAGQGLAADSMLATNPALVLRNHLAEEVIAAAQAGDFGPVQALHAALQRPYDAPPGHPEWTAFPPEWASRIQISCSS